MNLWRFTIKTSRGKLEASRIRNIWLRFGRYTKPHRWSLGLALAAGFGVIAMQVAAPWPIKLVFDHILSDKMQSSWLTSALGSVASGPYAILGWVCAAVMLFAITDALCSYVRDVQLAQTGQQVVGKIRRSLFSHLQTLPPSAFERRRTGELLMRLTGDIQMLRQMLVNAVMTGGQSALTIVAMVAAMFWLNPLLAILGISTVPLTLWATWRISNQIRRATKSQREKESVIASIAHDVLGAMTIVQAFNREETEKKRFSRENRSSMRAGVRTTRLQSKLYRTISLASALAMCGILYVGVRTVLSGAMTPGDLLVFVAYLRALNKPMRNLAKLGGQVAKATACGERVAELFAIEPAVRSAPNARILKKTDGSITFEDVTFSYDDGTRALQEATFAIEPGQRVAVVGRTGAGKSTLVKLLLRFQDPQEGIVRIGDANVREVDLDSLRRQIGWVHQDTILFGMTVAENIALGRPDADGKSIRRVARQVCAHEFIKGLPDGYDTVLGEGGWTLSGGQRQRLALARAILREPALLLLDEPASGLDEQTHKVVEQAWMASDNQATTVVICHRLRQMHRFDRIIVLSAGRVADVGSHSELLSRSTDYAAMYSEFTAPNDEGARIAC